MVSNDDFGATCKFPKGMLDGDDEGELKLGIATTPEGIVRVEFGTPIAWIGLGPQEAASIASSLLKHARAAARITGETITFNM